MIYGTENSFEIAAALDRWITAEDCGDEDE